jgi:tRNA(fMet)-specific endonuclease VapC
VSYLLDTNTCIRLLNRDRNSLVSQKLATFKPTDILLCSVVKAELYYGAHKSSRRKQNLAKLESFFSQFNSVPFDDQASSRAGEIRAQLAALGTPIGPHDLLIAAIALTNNLVLVTHNTQEFSRVEGLPIEDWE